MSARVTVTLPDDTYRRAEYLARMTGRGVADVLTDTIGLSLRPLGAQPTDDCTIGEFSDADVLVIADSQMDSAQDERLRELLGKQQAGRLTDEEYPMMLALMQVYQDGLLRKARALNEAVRRGLRPPLVP